MSSSFDSSFPPQDSLARHGNAPKVFTLVNRWGLPYMAVTVACLFGCLAYMGSSNGAGRVFGWSVSGICVVL